MVDQVAFVAAAVTMARIKSAHELRDKTLRVSKEHEFLRSLPRQQSLPEHKDAKLYQGAELEHIDAKLHQENRESVTNLHEMHVARCVELSALEDETVQRSNPIIQEKTKIPQTQRRTGARTARRDERKSRDGAHEASRERTANSAWCGKHRARLHQIC